MIDGGWAREFEQVLQIRNPLWLFIHSTSWAKLRTPLWIPFIRNNCSQTEAEKGHEKKICWWDSIPESHKAQSVESTTTQIRSLSFVASLPKKHNHWIIDHLGIWCLYQITLCQSTSGAEGLEAFHADWTEYIPVGDIDHLIVSSANTLGTKLLGVWW